MRERDEKRKIRRKERGEAFFTGHWAGMSKWSGTLCEYELMEVGLELLENAEASSHTGHVLLTGSLPVSTWQQMMGGKQDYDSDFRSITLIATTACPKFTVPLHCGGVSRSSKPLSCYR
jgi:hypothetical protein